MHFRILKMIATSGFLTALECTKFEFRPGIRPGPRRGSLQRSPRPSNRFKGDPTSKGKGRGEKRGRPSLTQIPGSAPGVMGEHGDGRRRVGAVHGDKQVRVVDELMIGDAERNRL